MVKIIVKRFLLMKRHSINFLVQKFSLKNCHKLTVFWGYMVTGKGYQIYLLYTCREIVTHVLFSPFHFCFLLGENNSVCNNSVNMLNCFRFCGEGQQVKRGLLKPEVMELVFYIYTPKATGLPNNRQSTWLNPIIDGVEAKKLIGQSAKLGSQLSTDFVCI